MQPLERRIARLYFISPPIGVDTADLHEIFALAGWRPGGMAGPIRRGMLAEPYVGIEMSRTSDMGNSMSRHLIHDLEEAYHRLLALSGQVEEMIQLAAKSLVERDQVLAEQVIDLDTAVDRSEVRIEEECLKMLALHQPVAADLRRLTTMMKVNNDLERMADLACNVAERATQLAEYVDFPIPSLFQRMADLTIDMVRNGLQAYVNLDIELAYRVIQQDDTIDAANVEIIDELRGLMRDNPNWIDPALHCFSASRHMERIADHATNVAEDVIYMVNGVIVRHRHGEPTSE